MKPLRGMLFRLKPDSQGKRRPVVVVSNDLLNGGDRVLVVPFYSQQVEKRKQQPWCVHFQAGDGGLEKECVAKTDELGMIDKLNLDLVNGFIGRFDDVQLQRVLDGIKWSLSIT